MSTPNSISRQIATSLKCLRRILRENKLHKLDYSDDLAFRIRELERGQTAFQQNDESAGRTHLQNAFRGLLNDAEGPSES
jgi:hypothetical protein